MNYPFLPFDINIEMGKIRLYARAISSRKVKGAIDPKLYAKINGNFFHDSEDVHPRYTNEYLSKVLEKMKPEFIRGWWTRELNYPRYEPPVADWAAALHEKKHGPRKRRRGEIDEDHLV